MVCQLWSVLYDCSNTDEIIYIGGAIFKATTKLSPGSFNGDEWTQLTTPVDYL